MVATTDAVMEAPEGQSSSSSRALLPPLSPALPAPEGIEEVPEQVSDRPILSARSSVAALRIRLKAVGKPSDRTKDDLWEHVQVGSHRREEGTRAAVGEARKRYMLEGSLLNGREVPSAPGMPDDLADISR